MLLPGGRPLARLAPLRGGWWPAIPPATIAGLVVGVDAAAGTATGLTYLALVAVPPLAAAALWWTSRMRPSSALLAVAPLFALTWAFPDDLVGQTAALVLVALSCVMLAGALRAVSRDRWLRAGVIVMTLLDVALVASDLLQAPNAVLDRAAPAAGLPALQRVVWGSGVMGYGDFFVAAAAGALLARDRRQQVRGALLAALICPCFDLLFLVAGELPSTVPVAAALLLVEAGRRRMRRSRAPRRPSRGRPAGGPLLDSEGPWWA